MTIILYFYEVSQFTKEKHFGQQYLKSQNNYGSNLYQVGMIERI